MDDLLAKETALNEALRQGRLLEAYTTFYHEGAHPLPSTPDPRDASAVALRFFEWADTFVGALPVRTMAGENVSCSEWRGVWCPPRDAVRGHGTRVVARHWRDGKVVRERVTARRGDDHVRPMGVPGPGGPPLSMPAHG
jgi:hypothetical protein